MMTDPIGDMLTRIRNASSAKKMEVVLPYSNVKWAIAKILRDESYVKDIEIVTAGKDDKEYPKEIKITLTPTTTDTIRHIARISKPGHRIYMKSAELPKVLNDLGIAIVSTPQGIMTNKEARKRKLGGEVICEVY